MGQFIINPTKAVVFLDNERLKLYPARIPKVTPSSSTSNLSTENPNPSPQNSRDLTRLDPRGSMKNLYSLKDNPILLSPNPLDVMFGGLFSGQGLGSLRGEAVGPPEAFYPFTTVTSDGTITNHKDDLYDYEDDEDDDDNLLDLDEIIDLDALTDVDSDASNTLQPEVEPSSSTTDVEGMSDAAQASSPLAPRRLLEHLDRGRVTAFRSNQDRYRIISREPQHPVLRAKVRSAVQKGRAAAATLPLAPLRKRRGGGLAGAGIRR